MPASSSGAGSLRSPDTASPQASTLPPERDAWLVFAPLLATAVYYYLPIALREHVGIMFAPQLVAYAALAAWMLRNSTPWLRLGLNPAGWLSGLRQGTLVGVALGAVNLTIILWVIPGLGGDMTFLRETPHAKAPLLLMFPLGIALIGFLVEVNFRGFQLGRLAALGGPRRVTAVAAVVISAVSFAWDPFMMHVFRSLHWMALWDGLAWGILILRSGTLYATITAHTIEVLILYGSLKLVLG